MPFSHYKGRCIGRLLHALTSYGWLTIADHSIYDEKEVRYWGEVWATYEWEGDSDIPHFVFNDDEDGWRTRAQEVLKPFLDDSLPRLNAKYVAQEVGQIENPTDEQIDALMKQYLAFRDGPDIFGYHKANDEDCAKYRDHFRKCGESYRDYVRWRTNEIETNGFVREGTYKPELYRVLKR